MQVFSDEVLSLNTESDGYIQLLWRCRCFLCDTEYRFHFPFFNSYEDKKTGKIFITIMILKKINISYILAGLHIASLFRIRLQLSVTRWMFYLFICVHQEYLCRWRWLCVNMVETGSQFDIQVIQSIQESIFLWYTFTSDVRVVVFCLIPDICCILHFWIYTKNKNKEISSLLYIYMWHYFRLLFHFTRNWIILFCNVTLLSREYFRPGFLTYS